jgi:hypothetical protein
MGVKSENSSTPFPLVALLFFTRTGGLIEICCSVSKQSARRRVSNSASSYATRNIGNRAALLEVCAFALLCAVKTRIGVAKLENWYAVFRRNSRDGPELKCTLFPTIRDQFAAVRHVRKRAAQKYGRKVCVL